MSLEKIITILSDGKFHDGSSIGKQLGMTRAGVWKIIQKLGSYDIEIKSVKGRGYALPEPLILLNKKKILHQPSLRGHVRAEAIHGLPRVCHADPRNDGGLVIEIFESITSTRDYLRSYHGSKQPRICLAEYQSQGMGRLERKWYAPFAQSICFSLLYPFSIDVSQLSGLSLVVGLAVSATIHDTYKIATLVKWPNDVVYQGSKLGGILIEVQAEANGACSSIISLGLNINIVSDDKSIDQNWTSIRQINNQYNDRNIFCSHFIVNLLTYIRRFEQQGLEYFVEEWKSKDALMNKTISLMHGKDKYTGKAIGINNQGHLLVALENGNTKAFSSGDTTILKNL